MKNKLLTVFGIVTIVLTITSLVFVHASTLEEELSQLEQELIDGGSNWSVSYTSEFDSMLYIKVIKYLNIGLFNKSIGLFNNLKW